MSRFLPGTLLLVVVAAGCGRSPQAPELVGLWTLNVIDRQHDVPLFVIEFAKGESGRVSATIQRGIGEMQNAALEAAEIENDSVRLLIQTPGGQFDFRGAREEAVVRGDVLFGGLTCFAAFLTPTQTETSATEKAGDEPRPSEGHATFQNAVRSDDPVGQLESFAKEHPKSPLALDAYQHIISLSRRAKLDAARMNDLASQYLDAAKRWGPRLEQVVRIRIGIGLSGARHLPDLALKYLEEGESHVSDELAQSVKPQIEMYRKMAQVESSARALESDDPAARQRAEEDLRGRLGTNPYNFLAIHALAKHAEKNGRIDEAIERYATLAVTPMADAMLVQEWVAAAENHPLPGESLARLWSQKHGSAAGLNEYVDDACRTLIYAFARQAEQTPSAPDNQAVLCELFTGAQCGPCVAADVAIGGLERVYPRPQLIVLRYHQHAVGPDPLTSEVGEARFAQFYQGQFTPTIVINGVPLPPQGHSGLINEAPAVFERLREQISPLLGKPSPIQLTLSAGAKDDELALAAEASGLPDTSGDLRLRLALVEEEIRFMAANGIRLHDMVVRAMPGGAEGIPPQNGRLAFAETIKLSDLKRQLAEYLASVELASVKQGQKFTFPDKPLALDKLHLVAFIQNDKTKEVLQAAEIPVEESSKEEASDSAAGT